METGPFTLFHLPTILMSNVVVNWIPLEALGRLDSAVCQSQHRSDFLSLLSDPFLIFNAILEDLGVRAWDYTYWIIIRKIKIARLLIARTMSSMHPHVLTKFFQYTGPYLRTLITNNFHVSPYVCDLVCSHCPVLERIEFFGTAVNKCTIDKLVNLHSINLRQLRVSGSEYVGSTLFRKRNFPKLEELCIRAGAEALQSFYASCPVLHTLSCSKPAVLLAVRSPTRLSFPFAALRKIEFLHVDNLSDAVLTHLVKDCATLSHIYLDSCHNISEVAFRAIANHCCCLTTLRLRNIQTITVAGVREVVSKCAGTLRFLCVVSCHAVNSNDIREFLCSYADIQFIDQW